MKIGDKVFVVNESEGKVEEKTYCGLVYEYEHSYVFTADTYGHAKSVLSSLVFSSQENALRFIKQERKNYLINTINSNKKYIERMLKENKLAEAELAALGD